jgi:hypothetical protein
VLPPRAQTTAPSAFYIFNNDHPHAPSISSLPPISNSSVSAILARIPVTSSAAKHWLGNIHSSTADVAAEGRVFREVQGGSMTLRALNDGRLLLLLLLCSLLLLSSSP